MNFFNKAYQGFRGLPMWAQGIIAVGGAAAVYFVGKGVIDRIKSQAQVAKEKETLKQVSKDLKGLLASGIRKSYSDSQYKQWADNIEKQFAGCDFSPSIFQVDVPILGGYSGSGSYLHSVLKKMKNDADMLALVESFGLRTYDQCGPRIFGITGDFGPASLNQAVQDELDQDEINGLNNLLTSPPKINYSF